MSSLIDRKVAGYFYDVPWKAWAETEKIQKAPSRDSLISELGYDPAISDDVMAAARLSRPFESVLLSELGKQFKPSKLYKLNFFAPWTRYELPSLEENKISQYVDKLGDLARSLKGEKYIYHALYFLGQSVWFDLFPNTPPIADPIDPTYTTFEHGSATASLLNILSCENSSLKFYGSISVIEIPSIQEFIMMSRKTRDLWASSWLPSVLLWGTIKQYVERYGPDVSVRPELSLNHYYLSWLANALSGRASARQSVLSYASKFAGLDENPKISTMSEKVVLVLPEDPGEGKVKEKLEDSFNESWQKVAGAVLERFSNSNYVKAAILKPPIKPIVNVLSVEAVYNEFLSKLGFGKLSCNEAIPELLLFFEYLYRKVMQYPTEKWSYGTLIANEISEVTKSGYEVCTVCGLLPASLYYHSTETGEEVNEVKEKADDRLCPYCAVKRLIDSESFEKILKNFGIFVQELKVGGKGGKIVFPSTSELALADYARAFLEAHGEGAERQGTYKDFFASASDAERLVRLVEKRSAKFDEFKNVTLIDNELLKLYGSTYYAIIKADGDFMGKGYWLGRLVGRDGKIIGMSEYVKAILSALGFDLDTLREKGSLIDAFSEKIKNARARLEVNDQEAQAQDCSLPLTTLYAYMITKSLTAQAVFDKDALLRAHAEPVYLGGDDILAFSPVRYGNQLVPVDSVLSSRSVYWKDAELGMDGFKSRNGFMVDSLRSYGRSYAIYVAHYKDPLPLSLSFAAYLLELKDLIEGKDVLFISSSRGIENPEFAVLKLYEGQNLNQNEIEALKALYFAFDDKKGGKKEVSNSLIYDLLSLRREYRSDKVIYRAIVERILKRNADEKFVEKILSLIGRKIGEQPCSDSYKEKKAKVHTSGAVSEDDLCSEEYLQKEICRDKEVLANLIEAIYYLR